jgi:hypothetical protein
VESGASNFRNVKPFPARDLNMLLTWAAGGTPRGSSTTPVEPEKPQRVWPLGEPDLRLQPATDFVMAADVQERVEEFTLDTGTTETRWLRAVDVLAGDPTVVRDVSVSLAPGTNAPPNAQRQLALW